MDNRHLLWPIYDQFSCLIRLGQQFSALRRQNGQQLLEGQKRGAQVEPQLQVGKAGDVGQVGRVVVRVEPGPGDATVVVVVQVPLDGRDVADGLFAQHVAKNQSFGILGRKMTHFH